MAKVTDRTELITSANDDLIHIVDVSDTTDSAEGTSKKITKENYLINTVSKTGDETIGGVKNFEDNSFFAGRLGIGTTSSSRALTVRDSITDTWVSFRTTNSTGKAGLLLGDNDSDAIGRIWYDNSSNDIVLFGNNGDKMRLKSSGTVNISSLSTSSIGLFSGDLWNDGGVVKIIT